MVTVRNATLVMIVLLALCLASLATAVDDCGGTPCSADPPTTPTPTAVLVPAPPLHLVHLPLVLK